MLIFLFVVRSSVALSAQDEITWATPDWSPFYILKGQNKGKGIIDAPLQFFQKKLTHYHHANMVMNFARFFKEMTMESNLCIVGILKNNEREKITHYSIPYTLALTQRLIIKKERHSEFGEEEEVSLEQLLKNPNLDTIFTKGRAYQKLHPLIDQYKDKSHVFIRPSKLEQLIKMLFRDRISYLVEYPHAALAIANQISKDIKIMSLTIKEQVPYVVVHVGCTKNAWGKAIIDQVNQIIRSSKNSHEYQEALAGEDKFLDEGGIRARKQLFYEVFLPMTQ